MEKTEPILSKLLVVLESPELADVPGFIVDVATKQKEALEIMKTEAEAILENPHDAPNFTTISALTDLNPIIAATKKSTAALEAFVQQVMIARSACERRGSA